MLRVAQVGTFDVDNLGDLLFPLVLRQLLAELSRESARPIELTCFSPRGCAAGEFYSDQPAALPLQQLDSIDAQAPFDLIFIGGGDIIRNDDAFLAALYGAGGPALPYSEIASPTRSARPRLVLLMPGVPFAPAPAFAIHLENSLRRLCGAALRDRISAQRLEGIAPAGVPLQVVPDLINAIADLFPPAQLPAPVDALPPGGYLCFQAQAPLCADVDTTGHALSELERKTGLPVVLMEMGACLGDGAFLGELSARFGFAFACRAQPGRQGAMLDKVALIARSRGYFGSSLHGAILANAYGVPHFCFSAGALSKIEVFYESLGPSAIGRCFADFGACAVAFDAVVAAVRNGSAAVAAPSPTAAPIRQFIAEMTDAADAAATQSGYSPRIDGHYRALQAEQLRREAAVGGVDPADRDARITELTLQLAQRENEVATLRNSTTWRLAAPLRALAGLLRH